MSESGRLACCSIFDSVLRSEILDERLLLIEVLCSVGSPVDLLLGASVIFFVWAPIRESQKRAARKYKTNKSESNYFNEIKPLHFKEPR